MQLPICQEIELQLQGSVLHLTLNRPQARNAMNLALVQEVMSVFDAIAERRDIRAVVLRGSEGNFCAGGDIKDMASARQAYQQGQVDPLFELNRAFGRMITQVNNAPQVVITLLEGAVLGGGLGLACIADIAIADINAQFGLPETSLGLPPAQIAPFVVDRIGLTQARRLVLTGARFNGYEARELGLVHFVSDSPEKMDALLEQQLQQIRCCAPEANRITKALLLSVGKIEHEALLDQAAAQFSAAVMGEEGVEGTQAFVEKRAARWAQSA
ncbi:enoyl-CoA hydratase/isomerase family protein [Motiliproteus coralliicola]|uniref:Enoyl-CoA hydratase/isomerase family protein n=1 Tax=Motiliproteus coralliicola TaxID=2283196 RepID=A0A369WQM6_9GAMM|nr:enoyl-CoA hydratase-related protein [Motiliproteus coralliicola]RDE24370.1 enoyl-CoA hydratase/isomerase family protein [Motiliproteus coralliicola]